MPSCITSESAARRAEFLGQSCSSSLHALKLCLPPRTSTFALGRPWSLSAHFACLVRKFCFWRRRLGALPKSLHLHATEFETRCAGPQLQPLTPSYSLCPRMNPRRSGSLLHNFELQSGPAVSVLIQLSCGTFETLR